MLEVAANGLLELLGRAMSAATDVALRERCEPTLDLVEPGCRGRSEVDVEPRVACEPGSDRRGLVRPVVVHHEVDVQLGRDAGLDGSQEPQCPASIKMRGRVASRRNVTRGLAVVLASFLPSSWSKAVGMWSKVAAVGNAAAQRRVVHGRNRCAAGASSTCPWPAGREAPVPLRGFEVSCVGHPSIGAGADLRRLPMTISFTRWLRQALTRRCSVRNCGLPA